MQNKLENGLLETLRQIIISSIVTGLITISMGTGLLIDSIKGNHTSKEAQSIGSMGSPNKTHLIVSR